MKKGYFILIFFTLFSCGETPAEVSTGSSNGSNSFKSRLTSIEDSTLLTPENFHFLGAFRMPSGDGGASRFGYGGGAMTLNPEGDPDGEDDGFPGSLYIVGHDHDQMVAEISIPPPLALPAHGLSTLNRAEFLQPFADITGGKRASLDQGNGAKIGGLSWFKKENEAGKIYWTAYEYYNVEGNSHLSHGRSSLDLSNPNAEGLWRLDDFHSQMTAGYIFNVPEYFADEYLEGKQLVSGFNIAQGVSFSSAGPALFAFAPWQEKKGGSGLVNGTSLEAIPLLYYKHVYPESSTFPNYKIPDWWHGGAWVETPKARAVIITGQRAMGDTFYGEARAGDCSPYKGYHGDPYEPAILFYDPNDLAKAAQGEKDPWEIVPYLEWHPTHDVVPTCDGLLFDAAFDTDNQLLYVLHRFADMEGEPTPLIYVYHIE